MKQTKGLNSARMEDAIEYLPNAIKRILKPPLVLPATEVMEDPYEGESGNLQGERIEKVIIPSNIIDIQTKSEFLLGLKISGHTNTLTEASNLIDEFLKKG